jgi:hypothetical protein
MGVPCGTVKLRVNERVRELPKAGAIGSGVERSSIGALPAIDIETLRTVMFLPHQRLSMLTTMIPVLPT